MNKILKILVLVFFSFFNQMTIAFSSEETIKIGLLVPLSGDNKEIGQQIIKSTRIALKDINSENIEIIPRDTNSNSEQATKSAIELKNLGVKIIIGPVFYESLNNLNKVDNVIFVSFTNKNVNLPKNVISAGVNATSQLNTIKKFLENKEIKKTIFLTPKLDYEVEIKSAIKNSKIKRSRSIAKIRSVLLRPIGSLSRRCRLIN